MESINLSQVNQLYVENNKNNVSKPQIPAEPPKQENEDNGKLKNALIALGVIGAAGVGILLAVKNKKKPEIPQSDDVQKAFKELTDIDFGKIKGENRGIAYLKDGTKFTGELKVKNGILEYKDGVLLKSTMQNNGQTTVREYVNGAISKRNGDVVDITTVQKQVKDSRAKFETLKNSFDEMDVNTYLDEVDKLGYVSNRDKLEILQQVKDKLELSDFEKRINAMKFENPKTKDGLDFNKKLDDIIADKQLAVQEAKVKAQEEAVKKAQDDLSKFQKELEAKAEAQQRIKNEEISQARSEQAQKDIFGLVDERCGKSATESARAFMKTKETIDSVLKDDSMYFNILVSKEEMKKRAEYLKKNLNPEAIKVLNGPKLRTLLTVYNSGDISYEEAINLINKTDTERLYKLPKHYLTNVFHVHKNSKNWAEIIKAFK